VKKYKPRKDFIALLFFSLYPFVPVLDWIFGISLGSAFTNIFIFSILALGLNVVVGLTGLLHLGIAAFFAIGAYTLAILTVQIYPFQIGFTPALVIATVTSAFVGVLLGAPTLKLRGDYLAIVTLGFGELVRVTFLNLFSITKGPQGLNPIPPPVLPDVFVTLIGFLGIGSDFIQEYKLWYYFDLLLLVLVVLLNKNIEHSRLGRSLVAVREDELAASCCGIHLPKVKLTAFALGCALAGLAGGLYAGKLTTTADPSAYDFNISIIVLCCVIIGGMGNIYGVIAGVFFLLGFDNIISPLLTKWIQGDSESVRFWMSFNNWRWFIFGLALIGVARFRPTGLFPAQRVKNELL